MWNQEIQRLTRRKWNSVDQLAQEIFAIFTSDVPVTLPGLTLQPPAGSTAPTLTISGNPVPGYNPGGVQAPSIAITRGNITTTITQGDDGGLVLGGTTIGDVSLGDGGAAIPFGDTVIPGGGAGGTITPTPPDGDGTGGQDLGAIPWPGGDGGVPTTTQDNPISLYGEVRSHAGGDTYNVEVWARPPRRYPSLGTIPVIQGLIAAGEVIPNGTPVVVVAFPELQGGKRVIGEARMQVPVWLGEAS